MTIKELLEESNSASDTLSTQVRYVNYGFIAVCWILSGQAISGIKELYSWILLFIVLSLFFDVLQYLWQSVISGCYIRSLEKKNLNAGEDRKDFLFPSYIGVVSWILFVLKVLFTLVAAVLLIVKFF